MKKLIGISALSLIVFFAMGILSGYLNPLYNSVTHAAFTGARYIVPASPLEFPESLFMVVFGAGLIGLSGFVRKKIDKRNETV